MRIREKYKDKERSQKFNSFEKLALMQKDNAVTIHGGTLQING